MSKVNGGIIGGDNTPNFAVASGMWALTEVAKYVRQSFWPPTYSIPIPNLFLDFQSTTTLDSRITFTRATNGTYFNSSGVLTTASSGVARFDHRLENGSWVNKGLLIEEQRTNVCLQSENFSTTWANVFTTETTDATTAPDGNTTADAILETADNNFHTVFQNISANMTSTNFTFSVYVKANGRSRGFLQVAGPTAPVPTFNVYFDVSTPEIFLTTTGNGATLVASAIEDVGNGWYRVSASGRTGQNGTHVFRVYLIESGTTASYLGDVTKGFYLWGAQLEEGGFPTSYIKTTSASVTRNADVVSMTGTNFSSWYNATEGSTFWQGDVLGTKPSAAGSRAFAISDNGFNERIVVAPSTSTGTGFAGTVTDGGTAQANLLTPDPQVTPTAFQTYKHSLAYKVNDFAASLDGAAVATDTSGTLPTVDRIYIGANANGLGDYLNGHIANFSYWPARLTNGQLQYISQNGYINQNLALVLNFDQTTILDPRITFTRATNGTYFDSAGTLQTAGSGVARFDHRLESGVWVNKGLLIEETRTNLLLYSEEFNQTALGQWFLSEATITANSITAPDGTTTADRVVPTTANSPHGPVQSQSLTSGVRYSMSFFAKAGEYTKIYLGRASGNALPTSVSGAPAYYDLTTGTLVNTPEAAWTQTITDVGNGWYLLQASVTATATGSDGIGIRIIDDSGNISFTGDNTKGIYVWGAQLEAGAFPTSYIKTTSASATRNQDIAQMSSTNFSSWFNATEGTVFAQVGTFRNPVGAGSGSTPWNISDGATGERLQLSFNDNSGSFSLRSFVSDNASFVSNLIINTTFVANQAYKTASTYKVNDFAFTTDGASVLTDTSGTLPTVNLLTLGGVSTGNNTAILSPHNGHIAKFYYWNTRKPDNFLIGVTK